MLTHRIDSNTICLISELSDDTLKIVIEDKIKSLKEYTKYALGTFQDTFDTLSSWLDTDALRRKSKQEIQKWTEELSKYILEASIRWLDFKKELQELFWRKEKTTNISYLLTN